MVGIQEKITYTDFRHMEIRFWIYLKLKGK